jgi:hypothetical protein
MGVRVDQFHDDLTRAPAINMNAQSGLTRGGKQRRKNHR